MVNYHSQGSSSCLVSPRSSRHPLRLARVPPRFLAVVIVHAKKGRKKKQRIRWTAGKNILDGCVARLFADFWWNSWTSTQREESLVEAHVDPVAQILFRDVPREYQVSIGILGRNCRQRCLQVLLQTAETTKRCNFVRDGNCFHSAFCQRSTRLDLRNVNLFLSDVIVALARVHNMRGYITLILMELRKYSKCHANIHTYTYYTVH